MRGINKIILNTATMMEAVQEYLDKRSKDEKRQVVVKDISYTTLEREFTVKVESVEEFEEAAKK